MAVCEIHLNSNNALQKMTSFTAILPEGKSGPFPAFYLLHGLSDDHTAWTRRTSIERYVQDLPIIVVMPNGERSFYTDSAQIPTSRFETFITRDLVNFVDTTFQTIPTREARVIAGLSMGGYGAFKLALKYPHLFCAAVSHSGALSRPNTIFDSESTDWVNEMRAIFGDNPEGSDNDLFTLSKNIDRTLLPSLRFDCGTEDFLIEHNREFHRHLKSLEILHEYQEFPGEHSWAYWDEHIQETVQYFARHLKLENTQNA